jgi:ABC-type nitrate/sulfonate/bicarbonate transport system substrate-binding protein
MNFTWSFKALGCLLSLACVDFNPARTDAADRVIIGNVSRTVEQLPNYAATDKGFFSQEGIQGDVVLIGSTDTLIQALIAGQVNVAIVDPTPAINAVERGASLKIIGGTVPIAAYTLVGCPKYKSIKELKGTSIGVVSLVSGSTIFLREMLKKEGLELNRDYSIIQGGQLPNAWPVSRAAIPLRRWFLAATCRGLESWALPRSPACTITFPICSFIV